MQVIEGRLASDQADEDRLVEYMADSMGVKLAENRGKQHWLSAQIALDDLMLKLDEEVNELRITATSSTAEPGEVWAEAADVANFAAMIADRVSQTVDGV